jgi:hypothetical protein
LGPCVLRTTRECYMMSMMSMQNTHPDTMREGLRIDNHGW